VCPFFAEIRRTGLPLLYIRFLWQVDTAQLQLEGRLLRELVSEIFSYLNGTIVSSFCVNAGVEHGFYPEHPEILPEIDVAGWNDLPDSYAFQYVDEEGEFAGNP
jgi:hypothetical protein